MYFNGRSTHGENFKHLIEKFHLLKHLKAADVVGAPISKDDYLPSAFGKEAKYPEWLA